MIRQILLSALFLTLLISCSGNQTDKGPSTEENTGGVALSLVLDTGAAKDAMADTPDSSICDEINTVVVSVRDSKNTIIENQWACSLHSGTVTGVAPGEIVLVVKGFHADGTGLKTNLYASTEFYSIVERGKVSQVGEIPLQLTTAQEDWDGDGYTPDNGDCDDGDAIIHPGQNDDCTDEIDQDCDSSTCSQTLWFIDQDKDGFGDPDPALSVQRVVRPDNYSSNGDDCDDKDESIYPGATETAYDGIDQDCRDGDLADVDGDGYDAVIVGGPDLDDNNADISPGREENCSDQIDNNSNGIINDGCPWSKTYKNDSAGTIQTDDSAEIVIQANGNDGYIIVGKSLYQVPPYSTVPLITKIDEEGNQIWQKIPPHYADGYNLGLYHSAVQAHDGGYVFATGGCLVKSDENGSAVQGWNITCGSSRYDVLNSVIQTIDVGYVAVGKSYNESTDTYDVWLLKVDADGNAVDGFNKKFRFGSNSSDEATAVASAHDGGYVIVGTETRPESESSYSWILKTGANGEEEWRTDRFYSLLGSVVKDKDSGYVVVGYGSGQPYLQKFDEEGNQLWGKSVPNPHSDLFNYSLSALALANDDKYVIAGSILDTVFISKTGAGTEPTEWLNSIIFKPPYDHICSVTQRNDQRGYILAGQTIGDSSHDKMWIVKTDENGNTQELE